MYPFKTKNFLFFFLNDNIQTLIGTFSTQYFVNHYNSNSDRIQNKLIFGLSPHFTRLVKVWYETITMIYSIVVKYVIKFKTNDKSLHLKKKTILSEACLKPRLLTFLHYA